MKIKYAIYLVLIILISSCTKNFEDFNTDKKNPASVAGEALFSNALKDMSDQMNTPNVNRGIFELWAQYWTETTYTDEANYDIVERAQAEEVFMEGPFTIPASDSAAGIKAWLGGTYGASSPHAVHTQVAATVLDPSFPGLIMTYSEVLFYLAEAAARGFSVGMTEEEAYNAGITESILWWGGSQEDVNAYLAYPDVAYATAEGDWKRKIAYQSWLGSYINGMLGYTTWRRLDYPVLNITPTNEEIQAVTDIPVRFTFPVNEQTLNDVNYAAASEAIGGDDLLTKIFWDLYDANGE